VPGWPPLLMVCHHLIAGGAVRTVAQRLVCNRYAVSTAVPFGTRLYRVDAEC